MSWYADSGKRKCALLRAFSGPDSDVLAAAAMSGHPTLATACDNGEVSPSTGHITLFTQKLYASCIMRLAQVQECYVSAA